MMPFKTSTCKSSKEKKNKYIGMHKPLDLLLLLGHHDFYEMNSGYKETLTILLHCAKVWNLLTIQNSANYISLTYTVMRLFISISVH